ncbi:MAG: divalent-cation tolerance protein CutA [Ectothiorhodospiraceae bacterium]|nr:divalent-cation tolerance protein CutA [Chromatiales bacterium]MCP5157010.1 divalent-cation tolerance protein CutA [Ectothiorhodospiraceae bacterium]
MLHLNRRALKWGHPCPISTAVADSNQNAPRLVICTAPPDAAIELARAAVERRLAASANVIPDVRSVYRWQGDIREVAETLALFKTTAGRYRALERFLREQHPYEVPQILALEPVDGLAAYLDWIATATGRGT